MEKKNLKEEEFEIPSRSQPQEVVYQEEQEKSITLGQIWHMLKKHWVAIGICGLVGFAGAFAYGKFIKSPSYQASVQMMVISDDSSSTTQNITDSRTKAGIAEGYLTSTDVLTETAKKLDEAKYTVGPKDSDGNTTKYNTLLVKSYYDVSLAVIGSNTSATSIYLTITATCNEAQMAIDVANSVADSAIELVNNKENKINSLLGDSLFVTQKAQQAKNTSTSIVLISAIGILAGLVVGAAYAIIRELADTRVTSKSELETLSGYKVIGMIPKYETNNESEKGEKDNGTK